MRSARLERARQALTPESRPRVCTSSSSRALRGPRPFLSAARTATRHTQPRTPVRLECRQEERPGPTLSLASYPGGRPPPHSCPPGPPGQRQADPPPGRAVPAGTSRAPRRALGPPFLRHEALRPSRLPPLGPISLLPSPQPCAVCLRSQKTTPQTQDDLDTKETGESGMKQTRMTPAAKRSPDPGHP